MKNILIIISVTFAFSFQSNEIVITDLGGGFIGIPDDQPCPDGVFLYFGERKRKLQQYMPLPMNLGHDIKFRCPLTGYYQIKFECNGKKYESNKLKITKAKL